MNSGVLYKVACEVRRVLVRFVAYVTDGTLPRQWPFLHRGYGQSSGQACFSFVVDHIMCICEFCALCVLWIPVCSWIGVLFFWIVLQTNTIPPPHSSTTWFCSSSALASHQLQPIMASSGDGKIAHSTAASSMAADYATRALPKAVTALSGSESGSESCAEGLSCDSNLIAW